MAKVRADSLLVARGLSESRAKARAAIEAGGVRADGRPVTKASEPIEETALLEAPAAHPWVGRGALKLAAALEYWPVSLEGRAVLDVGSSTGGFTEVALAHGARRVWAVDVGRDQLHAKLRADPRVTVLEGVDARSLTAALIDEAPDVVVCDASFIGLAKVLPQALGLARAEAELIALVKPQFEVGPDAVGKGGIVKDQVARERALTEVSSFLEAEGWSVLGARESPITGVDGNREYLLHARKRPLPEGSGPRSHMTSG